MKLLLQLACGLPLDAQPQMAGADGYAAVAAIIPRRFGTLKAIHLPQWAQEPGTNRHLIMVAKPGDSITPLEHNAQRSGYACSHAATYGDAWDTALAMAGVMANNMEITDV